MIRKMWVLATVTLFGVSAVLAGNAAACGDDKAKTAAKTSATTTTTAAHSCCARDGAKTASVDAKKVHNSMIKSAIVAPGAAPILNVAAFGGALAAAGAHDCNWCPGMTTASTQMTDAECAAMKSAHVASSSGCGAAKTASVASSGCAAKQSAITTASLQSEGAIAAPASHSGCNQSTVTTAGVNGGSMTMAAGGDGCSSKATTANAGSKDAGGCCEGKTASTASADKCSTVKTASLKGLVDDMPYRENKRVVLAGATYACGHCSLEKTSDCSPMLKTADGKVYPLVRNNNATAMRGSDGKNLEVSGTVKKVDGVKYLEVKSYKVM
jgi:hypothetical protein